MVNYLKHKGLLKTVFVGLLIVLLTACTPYGLGQLIATATPTLTATSAPTLTPTPTSTPDIPATAETLGLNGAVTVNSIDSWQVFLDVNGKAVGVVDSEGILHKLENGFAVDSDGNYKEWMGRRFERVTLPADLSPEVAKNLKITFDETLKVPVIGMPGLKEGETVNLYRRENGKWVGLQFDMLNKTKEEMEKELVDYKKVVADHPRNDLMTTTFVSENVLSGGYNGTIRGVYTNGKGDVRLLVFTHDNLTVVPVDYMLFLYQGGEFREMVIDGSMDSVTYLEVMLLLREELKRSESDRNLLNFSFQVPTKNFVHSENAYPLPILSKLINQVPESAWLGSPKEFDGKMKTWLGGIEVVDDKWWEPLTTEDLYSTAIEVYMDGDIPE